MRQPVLRRPARGVILGARTLVLAAVLAVAAAPGALAGVTPSPSPSLPPAPGEDASCDTRPTTYPADGSPLATDATCVVITDAAGAAVGETWSWQDADSVHWYNYAATGVPSSDGTVLMCGSTGDSATGAVYTCTANSTYLLFAVSGVFVEWPTAPLSQLHFCQSITFGAGAEAVGGAACATVAGPVGGVEPPAAEETTAGPSPTQVPTEPVVTDTPVPPAPSDVPSDSADPDGTPVDEPAQSASPLPPAESSPDPTPGRTATPVPPPGTSAATAAAAPRPGEPGVPTQTPVESESVAIVGGSRFPMLMVLVLAGGLALGGYATLAGPGLLAARRRRP